MSSPATRAARRSWAVGLLAAGDSCGLCQWWEFVVQAAGGAPAVGDCLADYEQFLRTATAKPCERFERDAEVEAAARGGKEPT